MHITDLHFKLIAFLVCHNVSFDAKHILDAKHDQCVHDTVADQLPWFHEAPALLTTCGLDSHLIKISLGIKLGNLALLPEKQSNVQM